MRDAHPAEAATGMTYYVSETDGVRGRLREHPEDFQVTEIERVDTEPLDADPNAYRHLIVRATLRGWDTNDFAAAVADRLGISRERVAWAGTKDKRAVTTQLVSIRGVDATDLPELDRVTLEPVGRLGRSLRFGDLAGNAFRVTVTDPEHPDNAPAITAELRDFGGGTPAVPNYFGSQRFGSRRVITHEVGLAVVRGDRAGAVMAYIGNPSDREPDDTRRARRFVEETRDWTAALDRMPHRLGFERAILHRLAERDATEPNDFKAALEALPENLQALLVNAAQSYVFNRILSARLERDLPFTHAVEGDVVCFAETVNGLTIPDTGRLQPVGPDRVAVVNRHLDRGRAFVTAPLVGTETEFGTGEPGHIERSVLDDVGIEPADFDLPGAFGSTGTRRAVLVRTEPTIEGDPLRFSFTLPKGSYATVLLREYLKVDPDDLA